MSEKQQNDSENSENQIVSIIESRVFGLAMKVAEGYAYSKHKVYRILQHAFEKLREESARNRVQAEFKAQISILMRMVKAYYKGLYRKIPTSAILKIIAGLIYFVWILDVIPDFIPILGLADDVAVIVWVYNGIKAELEDFEQWESVTAYKLENE